MQWIRRCCGCMLAVVLLTTSVYPQGIHEAVMGGRLEEVRQLIAADTALINATNEAGFTPLRLAIHSMNTEIVKLLLDENARTDDVHPRFGTVMSQAIMATCQNDGEPDLVELLIQHGVTLDASQVDALGMAPLDWAVHFGNVGMAQLALRHGADVNLVCQRLGRSPLVGAVSNGNNDLVTLLLEHGADASIVDRYENPPIFYAVAKGRTVILDMLLAHGASTDFSEQHFGRTLLHIAAIKGYRDIAEALVSRGAKIGATDNAGKTPLFYAAKYSNHDTGDYLTGQGATLPRDLLGDLGKPPRLKDNMDAGEASIWYLNHRGWAVSTRDHLLVFDAEEFGVRRPDNPSLANGFLTAGEVEHENVVALYSCYHGQPGEPAYIHTLADSLDDIAYVHLEDDAWRGSSNTTYLQANADTRVADVTVQTIAIADYMPTLAYLCQAGGLSIYYQAFGTDAPDTLRQRYEFLDRFVDTVDVAFLPLPESDQEESDLQLFLERFPTRSVVLLDPSRREYMFPDAARRVADWGFQTQVLCAENPGDHFDYQSAGE